MSASASPPRVAGPSGSSEDVPIKPTNKHLPTAVELQRAQLSKLLKDPSKPVHIPAAPKEKTLRAPREMMKNVQGSSAGAGSGEFHVYKQNRRREYERLKLMDEKSKAQTEAAEFEARKRARDEAAEAKTAKNRAKRQKKKAAAKGAKSTVTPNASSDTGNAATLEDAGQPTKKRRLQGGGETVKFRRPGEDDSDEEDGPIPAEEDEAQTDAQLAGTNAGPAPVVDSQAIIIHDDE